MNCFNKTFIIYFQHATYAHLLKPKLFFRHKRAIGVAVNTPAPKRETTTEDIVMFTPGERVSLEVPDQLFGSGYTLITNISEIVGNLIQVTQKKLYKIPYKDGMKKLPSMSLNKFINAI